MSSDKCIELNYIVPELENINTKLLEEKELKKFIKSFADSFFYLIDKSNMDEKFSEKKLVKTLIEIDLDKTKNIFFFYRDLILKYLIINTSKSFTFEIVINEIGDTDCFKYFCEYFQINISEIKNLFLLKNKIEDNTIYFTKEMQKIISEIKSELPLILANAFDVYAGNIIKNDGVSMTPKEYSIATNTSYDELKKHATNAKQIINIKLKRKGFTHGI